LSILIPRVYRSFPTLRGLPVEVCERLQRRALARRRVGVIFEGLLAGLIGSLAFSGGTLVLSLVALEGWVVVGSRELAAAVVIVSMLLAAAAGGLLGFRFVVAQALAVELETILAPSNGLCNQCRYPLGGLPFEVGMLRCPECGLVQSPPLRVDELLAHEASEG
jgi:hypothetical protein